MSTMDNIENNLKCMKCSTPYGSDRLIILMTVCKHHVCQVCYVENKRSYGTICAVCEKQSDNFEVPLIREYIAIVDKQSSLISQLERKLEDGNKKKKPRLEEQLKCQNCDIVDVERKMHLCETCDGSYTEGGVDVLNLGLCANCAIEKHVYNGHSTSCFFPSVRDYMFKVEAQKVETELKGLGEIWETWKAEMEKMLKAIKTKVNQKTDIARNCLSTIQLQTNMGKLLKFIETAGNFSTDATNYLKSKTVLLENISNEMSVDEKLKRKSKGN